MQGLPKNLTSLYKSIILEILAEKSAKIFTECIETDNVIFVVFSGGAVQFTTRGKFNT